MLGNNSICAQREIFTLANQKAHAALDQWTSLPQTVALHMS